MALRHIQYLAQRGYLLWLRPATRKMCGSIQAAQVSKVKIKDIPLPIGTLSNNIVMKNDRLTITTHMYIKFDSINRERESITKGCKGVFRGQVRAATVSNALQVSTHNQLRLP